MIKKSAVKKALKQRAQEVGILILFLSLPIAAGLIEKYV